MHFSTTRTWISCLSCFVFFHAPVNWGSRTKEPVGFPPLPCVYKQLDMFFSLTQWLPEALTCVSCVSWHVNLRLKCSPHGGHCLRTPHTTWPVKQWRLDNKEIGLWAGFTSFNFFLFPYGVKVHIEDLMIPIYNGAKARDTETQGEDGTWDIRGLTPSFLPSSHTGSFLFSSPHWSWRRCCRRRCCCETKWCQAVDGLLRHLRGKSGLYLQPALVTLNHQAITPADQSARCYYVQLHYHRYEGPGQRKWWNHNPLLSWSSATSACNDPCRAA